MNHLKPMSEQDVIQRINQLDKNLAALHKQMALSHFYQLTGMPYDDPESINAAVNAILLDPGLSEIVETWRYGTIDNRLKRRLDVLSKSIRAARVANDPEIFRLTQPVQKTIIEFTARINGRPVSRSERNRILEEEPDREKRRQAYYAGKELDTMIEADVKHVILERNRAAQRLGYDDYIALGLENQDLTETDLLDLFETVRESTADEWNAILQKGCDALKVDDMRPWDLSYYLHSLTPSSVKTAFPGDRIADVFGNVLKDAGGDADRLPIRVTEADIPYGGLCIAVEFNRDVRILSNPRDGFTSYDILFHEFGHGIQSVVLDASSFIVAEGDPPFFWEGIAGIYQHLMQSPDVLKTHFGLDLTDIQQIRDSSRISRMNWFRSIAATCRLEWAAYRGETDLAKTMRDLTLYYQGIRMPDDVGWAGNTLFTTHPLYSQNYLMMDVMAMHTILAFSERYGRFPSPGLFSFINTHYIEPAGWVPWQEKIVSATGSRLSPDGLIRYLRGDVSL